VIYPLGSLVGNGDVTTPCFASSFSEVNMSLVEISRAKDRYILYLLVITHPKGHVIQFS